MGELVRTGIFDVKVFNPYAPSNQKTPLSECYRSHENEKKRKYDQRIREVEHASFTPLILSCTGGLGPQATTSYKRLASLLSTKWNQAYSLTIMWLRCRLASFPGRQLKFGKNDVIFPQTLIDGLGTRLDAALPTHYCEVQLCAFEGDALTLAIIRLLHNFLLTWCQGKPFYLHNRLSYFVSFRFYLFM